MRPFKSGRLAAAAAGVMFLLLPEARGFEFALGRSKEVKAPEEFVSGQAGSVSVTGLVSERTKRVALRPAAVDLARDGRYLYLAVTSQLPADPQIKLAAGDTVFFQVTSPDGKKADLTLDSTGKGTLPAGVVQSRKFDKKNYIHAVAVPWSLFGVKEPSPGSVWRIQAGRFFQSPAEKTCLALPGPARVRMEDDAPSFAFRAEKSGWETGYFPRMVWTVANSGAKAVSLEGKADVTWIGNPINFQKKQTLAPGEKAVFTQLLSGGADSDLRTCRMEFRYDGKVLLARTLELGGAGIPWQATLSTQTRFDIGVYPSLDTVKAVVSNRNPALLKDFDRALFQVVDENGKVFCSAEAEKANGRFYARWALPRLAAGNYFVTAELAGRNGKTVKFDRKPFEYKRFDWENNRIGLDRVVIPPFKPLVVDRAAKKVDATLTGYTLGGSLLEGVTSQGEELLTGPVTFSVNGKALKLEKFEFTETSPDRVRASAAGTAGPLKVRVTYDIDYDGMVWVTMDFDTGKWAFIKDMRLEIPMKGQYARYLHATCARTRKHPSIALADKEGVVFNSRTDAPNNFLSYVWYGGPWKGLCWFTETEKEWNYDPDRAAAEVVRTKDAAVLRVNMINRKTLKKGGFSLAMGFQATPVKPVMPHANRYGTIHVMTGWTSPRALRMTTCVNGPSKGMKPAPETPFYQAKHFDTTSWEPYDYSILRMLKNKKLTAKERRAVIDDYIAKYLGGFSEKTRNRYRGLADHGASCYTKDHDKLLFYFNPRSALLTWEPYRVFQDEWYCGHLRSNYEGMYSAEPVKSYQDYVMPILREFVRNGLDGIYYDCTYESASIDEVMYPDGDHKSGRRLFMNMRQLVKRTATMMYLEGRKIEDRPFVEVHVTNCAIIPMMSFASHALGWEIFYGPKDYQQRFNDGWMIAESIGTQAGVVSKLLIDCRSDPERLQKTALAVTLPYGLLNHVLTGGSPAPAYKKALTVLDNFGYRDPGMEIRFCYDPRNPVRSLDGNVKLMTLKMKDLYLLCAGNTGTAGGKLDLDISRLGFEKPFAADALTGEVLAAASGRLAGEMPFHGYRLILVGGSEKAVKDALKRIDPEVKER